MATKKAKSRGPAKKRGQETDVTDNYLAPKPQEMEIRPFKWTEKQENLINIALDKDTRVVVIKAVAGVGKSLTSMFCSLMMLKQKRVEGITYIRCPVESSTHRLGFLPAGIEEKLAPYAEPAIGVMKELISEKDIKNLQESGAFTADAIGFIKGRTFHKKAVIMDEGEDLDFLSLCLMGTRMGKGSILFVIGDTNQSNVKDSGFDKFFRIFNDEESRRHGIHCFEFGIEDCMRSGITKYILGKVESHR